MKLNYEGSENLTEKVDKPFLHERLERIVGSKYVSDDDPILETYSLAIPGTQDGIPQGVYPRPDFVVLPGSVEEIQRILYLANRYKVPVVPSATYRDSYGQSIPLHGGILLQLKRMNRYWLDEDAMIIIMEPGVTFGQLTREVMPKGYVISYNPPILSPSHCIIGTISQRGAGPYSSRTTGFGLESVTCLEVVLPTGEIIRTGSAALPGAAWSSRYELGPDMTGLFLGASGALGIITKMGYELYPVPEEIVHASVFAGFKSLDDVVKPLHKLRMAGFYGNVTTWGPLAAPYEAIIDVPLGGGVRARPARKELFESDRKTVEKILKEEEGTILEKPPANRHPKDTWITFPRRGKFIQDALSPFPNCEVWFTRLKGYHGGRIVLHASPGSPARNVSFMKKLREIGEKYLAEGHIDFWEEGCCGWLADKRMGHGTMCCVHLTYNAYDPVSEKKAKEFEDEMYKLAVEEGAPIYRLTAHAAEHYMPRLGGYYELLKNIKQVLDPNNIMSPGRLILSYQPKGGE